jgi:thioredoxin 2
MSTYDVSCSFCGTKNRVPAEKEGKLGRCGNCHKELPPMYYRPQQLTERTFDTFIRGYNNRMLAEFWAPWCPHCVAFAPTVQKLAEMLAGETAVAQINSQENPALAQRFGVTGIPVLLLLREGKVVDRLSGSQSSEAIISWFRRHR